MYNWWRKVHYNTKTKKESNRKGQKEWEERVKVGRYTGQAHVEPIDGHNQTGQWKRGRIWSSCGTLTIRIPRRHLSCLALCCITYRQQCQKCIQLINAFQKATNYQSGHTVNLIPFLFSFFNVKKVTFTFSMQVISIPNAKFSCNCRKYNTLLPFCFRNI